MRAFSTISPQEEFVRWTSPGQYISNYGKRTFVQLLTAPLIPHPPFVRPVGSSIQDSWFLRDRTLYITFLDSGSNSIVCGWVASILSSTSLMSSRPTLLCTRRTPRIAHIVLTSTSTFLSCLLIQNILA